MRQPVRVFIDDGIFCPGFQFLLGGQPNSRRQTWQQQRSLDAR
jgi:hypothetical protein